MALLLASSTSCLEPPRAVATSACNSPDHNTIDNPASRGRSPRTNTDTSSGTYISSDRCTHSNTLSLIHISEPTRPY